MMQRKKKEQIPDGRWARDSDKEAYWRKQLALWQKSGLSIRAFCKEHGVVETSFYAWRRELIIRAREHGEAEAITPDLVTPNTVKDGRGREIAIRYRQTDPPEVQEVLHEASNPFVPIRLLNVEESRTMASDPIPERNSAKDIEIALPGGARIRINEHSNVRLVAELLSALKG